MGRENLNMVIALPAVEARKARADQLSCGVARSSILGQRLTIYALRSHGRFTPLSGRVLRQILTSALGQKQTFWAQSHRDFSSKAPNLSPQRLLFRCLSVG
jgi:hypothetical protein